MQSIAGYRPDETQSVLNQFTNPLINIGQVRWVSSMHFSKLDVSLS